MEKRIRKNHRRGSSVYTVNSYTFKAAKMIVDDEVDILVELAGHTAGNRLDIMAMKPAPIQITYLG